jgi:hypothetical protein
VHTFGKRVVVVARDLSEGLRHVLCSVLDVHLIESIRSIKVNIEYHDIIHSDQTQRHLLW